MPALQNEAEPLFIWGGGPKKKNLFEVDVIHLFFLSTPSFLVQAHSPLLKLTAALVLGTSY